MRPLFDLPLCLYGSRRMAHPGTGNDPLGILLAAFFAVYVLRNAYKDFKLKNFRHPSPGRRAGCGYHLGAFSY